MMKKKRAEQAEETKNKILNTALSLFQEESIDAVKVTDICRAAGVSVGAFYHYYPSKVSIIEDTYIQIDQRAVEAVKSLPYGTRKEQILLFLDSACKIIAERGHYFVANVCRIVLQEPNSCMPSDERSTTKFIKDAIVNGVQEGEFTRVSDAKETADTIMRTVRGIVFDWGIAKGEYSMEDEVRFVVSCMLENL
jgi:AcrR family transcriptional regulator